MESKKTPKADLENKRGTFVYLGLAISIGVVLAAFNWTTAVSSASSLGEMQVEEIEDEIIPITTAPEVKPPPPPPPPAVIEMISIVDDDIELEDDLIMEDSEADDETVIEIAPIVDTAGEEAGDDEIFFSLEEPAEFPGGMPALAKFLGNNIKYPTIALENGVQGRVSVRFIVNKDGSIVEPTVLRPVNPALDKEAIRVVQKMPKWKPGKQRGKAVRCYFVVPVNFKIQ